MKPELADKVFTFFVNLTPGARTDFDWAWIVCSLLNSLCVLLFNLTH